MLTDRDFLYLLIVFAYLASVLFAFTAGMVMSYLWRKR